MSGFLFDTSVWIAAVFSTHPFHRRTRLGMARDFLMFSFFTLTMVLRKNVTSRIFPGRVAPVVELNIVDHAL